MKRLLVVVIAYLVFLSFSNISFVQEGTPQVVYRSEYWSSHAQGASIARSSPSAKPQSEIITYAETRLMSFWACPDGTILHPGEATADHVVNFVIRFTPGEWTVYWYSWANAEAFSSTDYYSDPDSDAGHTEVMTSGFSRYVGFAEASACTTYPPSTLPRASYWWAHLGEISGFGLATDSPINNEVVISSLATLHATVSSYSTVVDGIPDCCGSGFGRGHGQTEGTMGPLGSQPFIEPGSPSQYGVGEVLQRDIGNEQWW